jgi:hypothetical protein
VIYEFQFHSMLIDSAPFSILYNQNKLSCRLYSIHDSSDENTYKTPRLSAERSGKVRSLTMLPTSTDAMGFKTLVHESYKMANESTRVFISPREGYNSDLHLLHYSPSHHSPPKYGRQIYTLAAESVVSSCVNVVKTSKMAKSSL